MSKKLHEEALLAAWRSRFTTDNWADKVHGAIFDRLQLAEAFDAYLAHLAAHGVKLTPREPTNAMRDAWWRVAQAADLTTDWHAMHDAAPDWPGDAE